MMVRCRVFPAKGNIQKQNKQTKKKLQVISGNSMYLPQQLRHRVLGGEVGEETRQASRSRC